MTATAITVPTSYREVVIGHMMRIRCTNISPSYIIWSKTYIAAIQTTTPCCEVMVHLRICCRVLRHNMLNRSIIHTVIYMTHTVTTTVILLRQKHLVNETLAGIVAISIPKTQFVV